MHLVHIAASCAPCADKKSLDHDNYISDNIRTSNVDILDMDDFNFKQRGL